MAGRTTRVGDIAKDYLRRYPDVPLLRIARMMAANDPKTFTQTSAYNLVQWHSGKQGKRSRAGKSVKPIKSKTRSSSRVNFVYRAPKSFADPFEPFVINGAQRILKLCDIHYPFHDADALTKAIEEGAKIDPTIVLLNGDIIDCHDESDFDKDPRFRYTEVEMKMIGGELAQFRQAFPNARIIWKEGNHEARLQRYLLRRAPHLYGLPGMDIPGLVTMHNGADAMLGTEWVSDKRAIITGKMTFLHGHEYRGGGGLYPAKWIFARTGEDTSIGHFHRTDNYSEPSISRKPRRAFSSGCLCDLAAPHEPYNKWNHGFQMVDVSKSGLYEMSNLKIEGGKVKWQ